MNQIFIDDIRTLAQIGIYPHELTGSQTVSISLCLGIGGQAARSDRIEDTIDYAVLVERLRFDLAQRRFGLLEHLADYLASLIFDEFRPLWLTLTVHKPDVLQAVGRVGIQIKRTFEQHIAGADPTLHRTAWRQSDSKWPQQASNTTLTHRINSSSESGIQ